MNPVLEPPARPPTNRVPIFGLVCITRGDAVRFRTVTRTRLLTLSPDAQAAHLRGLYADNVARLRGAVDFCVERGIGLYRISSALFPSADTPEGEAFFEECAPGLAEVGAAARAAGVRLISHPDQFIVLSSDSEAVVKNSVDALAFHARVMDRLGQPRSSWAALILHGGKSGRCERLVETARALPEAARARLVLENDEDCYGASEILEACRAAGVPMVFDAHHHVCHEGLDSYEDPSVANALRLARDTWPDPDWQVTHLSNGRERFRDTRHSDFISAVPSSFADAPYIEVEAKAKEDAVDALRRDWPRLIAERGAGYTPMDPEPPKPRRKRVKVGEAVPEEGAACEDASARGTD